MRNIKDILEGLLSTDINKLKAPEPIKIKEIDNSCFDVIRPNIETANNIIERLYIEPQLEQIKEILTDIGSYKLWQLSKAATSRSEEHLWTDLRVILETLEDMPKVDPQKLEHCKKWVAVGNLINTLFKDIQIKKELLKGYFSNAVGQYVLVWNNTEDENLDEEIVKRLEKKLPKNSFEITDTNAGLVVQKITFQLEPFTE